MVEKTKAIVHKQLPESVYETICGLYHYEEAVFEIQKSWRWVTCKRCLRSKPKKS